MNAHNYSIMVKRAKVDGEWYYVGTVQEFPNVAVYEDDFQTAYQNVSAVVEDLIKVAGEQNRPVPAATEYVDEEYSGRLTFRPGKRLHKEIVLAAKDDGQTQNQFLCTLVAGALATRASEHAYAEIYERAAEIIENQVSAKYIPYFGGSMIAAGTQLVASSIDQMLPQGFSDLFDGSRNYAEVTSGSMMTVVHEVPRLRAVK